jgi:hypothetical protein
MTQAYNRLPSEIFGVSGAAGYFFDRGIYLFGNYVEGEMSEAESRASNASFANMNRARAFARCMGDDMAKSSAGFADPFADGKIKNAKNVEDTVGQVLWSES